MKPVVIYHGNCADGFTSAWCFWSKHRDKMEYYPGVYQQDPPDVTDRHVYFVDFSYKRAVIEKMLETAKSITIIDHHKSAIKDLEPLKSHPKMTQIFNINKSGARLAWEFIYPGLEPLPMVLAVEDRDLWKFELPYSREIAANIFSHEYSFDIWDKIMTLRPNDIISFAKEGEAIERKHMKDINELVKITRRYMQIGGHLVPVASLPYTLSSDAGHMMAKGYPFAACYWDTIDGRIFSLRSTEDGIDVAAIAVLYGGGGHKHASGFKVDRNHILATS